MYNRISNTTEKINCRKNSPILAGPEFLVCDCVTSIEEIKELILYNNANYENKTIVIGRFTNILFSESMASYRPIMSLKYMNQISLDNRLAKLQAGTPLSSVVNMCPTLAALAGIPGTVGGALAGNAGANGLEIGDLVESVTAVDSNGKVHMLGKDECSFGYRNSIFKMTSELIIAEATLNIPAECEMTIDQVLKVRRDKSIGLEKSLGSFFLNPPGLKAGKLLEDAGLKGFRIGGAAVSEKHANILINANSQASAQDIYQLSKQCQEEVFKLYKISLVPEVILYGFY